MTIFAAVREAAATVARRARSVEIDDAALEDLAERLAPELSARGVEDPAHLRLGTEEETLAFVVSLDAVNFGSGWFPVLHKPEGRSGYFTIATAWRRRFEERGAFSASELAAFTPTDCTRVFGQDPENAEVGELMTLFARSLRDLGALLCTRFEGRFDRMVEAVGGSAAGLVALLAEMPLYRDVCRYDELDVPLYKRAQITAADLALAFDGAGPGRFRDLDELTLFADNLVPHVLRCEGVLRYRTALLRRIDAGERLAPGSTEEVEIRAVALHAVERMADHLGRGRAEPRELDRVLWSRGQSASIKARNRHRTRSVFY